jgi:hypothetical protein
MDAPNVAMDAPNGVVAVPFRGVHAPNGGMAAPNGASAMTPAIMMRGVSKLYRFDTAFEIRRAS